MENRLGRLIRKRRRARGLTQEQVEELSGVSQHHQSQIELGKIANPSDAVLEALASALQIDLQDIRIAQGWVVVVEVDDDERSVMYAGTMPADSVRWAETHERGETVRVWANWLGSRSSEDFFVVRASGDCLIRQGIKSGHYVLLRKHDATEPHDGQIVAVRIEGEYALKIWSRHDTTVCLRDGDGNVVYQVDQDRAVDFTILGVYVTNWNPVE